jgi:hypothetical protein
MKTQFTKGVSVERVTPPTLLGYCKAVGKSERDERNELAQDFDSTEKAKWRTALFVRYAKRLLASSEKIFADERLFHTPLPLPLKVWARQGLGYTPTEAKLTLGHIIVWWQDYRCSQVENDMGEHHYIYAFDIIPGKFGLPSKPYRVRYIGDNGHSYCTEIDRSLFELGNSLFEICSQYRGCTSHFDLEDAIEHLLGERVYQRL